MAILSRKTIAASVAAASLTAFLAGTPADAAWRGGWGAPVAAGVIGGLALGALAGAAHPVYAAPVYGPPVVYARPPCWFERQPVYDYNGYPAGYRRIRVCR